MGTNTCLYVEDRFLSYKANFGNALKITRNGKIVSQDSNNIKSIRTRYHKAILNI